jgi:hypothetical protein
MADQPPLYDIRVRRSRYNSAATDRGDLEAAGIVAALASVDVTAVFPQDEAGDNLAGDAVPAIYASVYAEDGTAAVRWSSAELAYAGEREVEAMRRVLTRAQRIADLANALAAGRDPAEILARTSEPGEPAWPNLDYGNLSDLNRERSIMLRRLAVIERAIRGITGSEGPWTV